MGLRPSPTTQKALLSTTSHFVGEWEQGDILISLAWPDFSDQSGFIRWAEGPASRSAVVLAFETESIAGEPGIALPDYAPTADAICSYISLLFGKRFDNHGLIEASGYSHVPDLTHYAALCDSRLPQNSHVPRADFPVPLNLAEITRIRALLLDPAVDATFSATFHAACKFYVQALQAFERDAEVAYLHLVTAGEILSGFQKHGDDVLLAEETVKALRRIREELPDGDRVARLLAGQLRGVKRRFVEAIMGFVDPGFFERSEAHEFGKFTEDEFRESVSAAYDLRSRYVHTGQAFGQWVASRVSGENNEVQIGQPVVDDRKLARILQFAPTYVGLERVIRYCLLRFAQSQGVYEEGGIEG